MAPLKAQEILDVLKAHYPKAHMILEWKNSFELLVAIILSAQCTDKKVTEVTSVVFPKYRKRIPAFDSLYRNNSRMRVPKEQLIELINFSQVPTAELEQDIKSTGFFHNKAKSVQGAANTVLHTFHGVLPNTIRELITIPGVGRKTANVFLGNAYGIYEGIAVDTHVAKQSRLLGLTKNTDPVKIEQDLMKLFLQKDWFPLTYLLIEHGRNMRRKKSDRFTCNNPRCILCTAI